MRAIWLIARTVLIEAVRRREVYAVVLVSAIIIGAVMTVDFFHLDQIEKFYREIALKVMNVATAATAIVLAARQLPREFESRTIYLLMARPISRVQFLLGKLTGVLLATAFCLALFMVVYVLGTLYLKNRIPWVMFFQYIYLQILMMAIIATLSFWLSLIMNIDAAISVSAVLYLSAAPISSLLTYILPDLTALGKQSVLIFIFTVPQLQLFDLSNKAVHGLDWPPLGFGTLALLTLYALIYSGIFVSFSVLQFRRRSL